jgi:hypothetical protein
MIATQTQELTQEWMAEAPAADTQPQSREETIRSLL